MPPKTAQAAAASLLATLPASADPRMERRLRDLGLSVQLMTGVNLKDFNEEASLHNQARLGKPVNLEVVDEYATKMRSGVAFPAIVAWDDPSMSRMLICDGNHRYQATKQINRDVIDAYFIDGDPMAIQIFMFTVNAEHGVPTDEPTRIHHALWLHDSGKTIRDAARMMSVKEVKVSKAFKLRDAGSRADSLRINRVKFDSLSQGVRELLANFDVDEVFKAITELTISAGLTADDIRRARQDLAGERSVTKQLDYIAGMKDAFRDQIATQGKLSTVTGKQVTTPRKRLNMILGGVNSWPEPQAVLELMTPQDRTVMLPKVKEAKARIEALYAALKAT
jgi:hypothetical protein